MYGDDLAPAAGVVTAAAIGVNLSFVLVAVMLIVAGAIVAIRFLPRRKS